MALSRRQFLGLLGGSAATAVIFEACGVPEKELIVQAPLEMPEDMVTGLDNWYATLCRQCSTSEGIVVRVMEGRAKKVEGNVDYPINAGKHSARCEAGLQALYNPDRISGPLVRVGERGEGRWNEISWTDALSRLADQLNRLQDKSRAVMVTDPVAAHTGMVVERFVSRLGARHLGYEPQERTNLRVAMKQVFDQDVLPDFDIENSSYILSFGADFLNSWVSPVRHARGYGIFRQGDRTRGTLVHVEPRFSMTAASADDWVYVSPGQEGLLALSIAQVIASEGLGDATATAELTGQRSDALNAFSPDRTAGTIGVSAERITGIARDFAAHRPALAIGGGSAGAHVNGLFNLKAIYALNFLVGSVGAEGGVVFNPDPALPCIPTPASVASFGEMQTLASEMRAGRVQALMVRGADPMYGLGESSGFRDASYQVPFIASFSGHMDDTTYMADLVLPEHNSLEDWGTDTPDPGPGYQTIGFQQPVVRPFFESRGVHLGTKNFPDVLLALAQILDIDLELPGESFKEILEDSARKLFDSGRGSVQNAPTFGSFWNGVLQRGGWWDTNARYAGRAARPSQLPTEAVPPSGGPLEDPYPCHLMPFVSSLGEGNGAHLPWLQATPDPISTATWRTWIEINSRLAEERDIKEGDVVRVVSTRGSIEALAYPHPGISPDVIGVPIGQGHRAGGRYAENRGSNVFDILEPQMDVETGALAWAATRVRVDKTDEWVRLPRFENSAPDLAVDEKQHIIELTPHDS